MNNDKTIAAICTAIGGAIAIIRISGSKSLEIGNKVWKGSGLLSLHKCRKLLYGNIITSTGEERDPAMCVYMPGPDSYTGEDIIEIHCHGGFLNTKEILELILEAGAIPAQPGEFTYRAFINGKMDLTQAEAVADIISAHSNRALHLAERQLAGKLGGRIGEIRNSLITILAECESRLDFVEEDLDWEKTEKIITKINKIKADIDGLLCSKNEGIILRQGIRIVIAGKPNVGKSSLLNLLLGFDRAIVTNFPGTTRDTIEECASIRDIPVKLIDTAGIRDADDLIEGIGVERSLASVKQAQVIFWMLDAGVEKPSEESRIMEEHVAGHKNIIAVWNKVDQQKSKRLPGIKYPCAKISVKENRGLDKLYDLFEKMVWNFPHTGEPEVAVSSRHAKLLEDVLTSLDGIDSKISSEDWELASLHLRDAVAALGRIIGEETDPDLLENIFSRFCIGK